MRGILVELSGCSLDGLAHLANNVGARTYLPVQDSFDRSGGLGGESIDCIHGLIHGLLPGLPCGARKLGRGFAHLAADPRVSVVTLSRNFGAPGAYTCGLEYASGDCVICIDGDIQDPPELIPAFVEKWREGYDVVYGSRVKRKGSIIRRIGYKAFYRIFRRLSYIDIPVDAGDFALMDRRVVDVINAMPERDRFIRGLRAWAGFRQTGIPYVRQYA